MTVQQRASRGFCSLMLCFPSQHYNTHPSGSFLHNHLPFGCLLREGQASPIHRCTDLYRQVSGTQITVRKQALRESTKIVSVPQMGYMFMNRCSKRQTCSWCLLWMNLNKSSCSVVSELLILNCLKVRCRWLSGYVAL